MQGQSLKSEENGCYVALLEYNGINGMMPINEYTTTMRKAIHRAMKVGKKEILRVIRVDREKGNRCVMQGISIFQRNRSMLMMKRRDRRNIIMLHNFTPYLSTLLSFARFPFLCCIKNIYGLCINHRSMVIL